VTLPEGIQEHVDAIKAALGGVPASQIVVNLDDYGTVQSVEPKITFRRKKACSHSWRYAGPNRSVCSLCGVECPDCVKSVDKPHGSCKSS